MLLLAHPLLEIVGIQIYVPDSVNIISVHRPPGYNKTKFISDLGQVLNNSCEVPTCLLGDFNEDLLDDKENHKVHTALTDVGFSQHIKVPTIGTGTLLDHVYTLKICDINVEVSDCYYSDHDIVFSSIQI